MNRFAFILFFLFSCFFIISCDNDEDYIVYPIDPNPELVKRGDEAGMKISRYMSQDSPGVSVQGAACYGDYLFQFENYNANVYIYNLKTKKIAEIVPLTPKSQNHCNNASFSTTFYEKGDEFPLLYVSGGVTTTYNHAQVYRILHTENGFKIMNIQEIEFPKASTKNKMYSTQVVMSTDCMYVLTKGSNQTFVSRFEIPDCKIPFVSFVDGDIIEQFEIDDYSHKQGAIIYEGFMYILYGVPAWGDMSYLRVLDLDRYEDTIVYNLSKMGYKQEFEGLAFYNDILVVAANHNAGIFIFHDVIP